MLIHRDLADDIICDDAEGWEQIEERVIDTDRWTILYEAIYKHEDKFYKVFFRRGATEYQEGTDPFDCMDHVEFYEAELKQVTLNKYMSI